MTDGETSILIDTGPDLRAQLLRAQITDVHAVLMTHEHNDHVAGIDDLRPINFLHRKTIPILAEPRVCKQLRQSFGYIFDAHYDYPGKPRLTLHEISTEPLKVGGFRIQPIRIMHGTLPILGFRTRSIAYLSDVKSIPETEIDKLYGLKYLFVSALHHRPHHSHMNLEEALQLIEILQPEKTYLTHISHHMGLHQDIDKTLPEGVNLGYDGLFIDI